jgi:glycosyltransferase involved in cell wall biosynthesis
MCGTPVIVSDDCGCGEIVIEANCSFTVKYGEVKQLKDKIKELIDNQNKSRTLVANGQAYIQKNFNWATVILKFMDLYANCVHNN